MRAVAISTLVVTAIAAAVALLNGGYLPAVLLAIAVVTTSDRLWRQTPEAARLRNDAGVIASGAVGYLLLAAHANANEVIYAHPLVGASNPALAGVMTITALTLLMLGEPPSATRRWLTRRTVGGEMVAWMLPVAAVVPLFMGWLVGRLETEGSLHGTFASTLLVEVPAVVLVLVTLVFSARMDRVERRSLAETAAARDKALAASRTKSAFLANMSHDLRTPLNGIIGMTSLMVETDLSEEQRVWMRTIADSSQALLDLVNDVLDVSMIEEGRLRIRNENLDLRQEVERLADLMSPAVSIKGIQLHTEVSADVPRVVRSDTNRVRQIITNLLSNAVKFTEDGEVHLRVSTISGEDDEPRLRIDVTDTGIGIPEDQIDAIFDPFTQVDSSLTRTYAGTGLGLAICRRIAQLMGGSIEVKSEIGVGSHFTVFLPLKAVMSAAPENSGISFVPAHDTAPPKDRKISLPGPVLVADDNAANQRVVGSMLKRMGLAFTTVGDGIAAVDEWQDGEYALVLMDCQMPRLDGYDATRNIRDIESSTGSDARTPVIAMTAHAMEGERERCLAAGMDDYLSKPFDLDQLTAIIRRWADHLADG